MRAGDIYHEGVRLCHSLSLKNRGKYNEKGKKTSQKTTQKIHSGSMEEDGKIERIAWILWEVIAAAPFTGNCKTEAVAPPRKYCQWMGSM